MWDGITISTLTPVGLLLLTVLLLLTGRIVPRRTYLDKVKEADQWHSAYELERAARNAAEAQTKEMFEVAKTNASFLSAIHELSQSKALTSGED